MGDPQLAAQRLERVSALPVLTLNEDVRELARIYQQELLLPQQAGADLLHIAFAVAYEMDYLVTWNCRHLANGEITRRLLGVNQRIQQATPVILTPEELMEGTEK